MSSVSHFGERFRSLRILKWHRHYCEYDALNKKLKKIPFDALFGEGGNGGNGGIGGGGNGGIQNEIPTSPPLSINSPSKTPQTNSPQTHSPNLKTPLLSRDSFIGNIIQTPSQSSPSLPFPFPFPFSVDFSPSSVSEWTADFSREVSKVSFFYDSKMANLQTVFANLKNQIENSKRQGETEGEGQSAESPMDSSVPNAQWSSSDSDESVSLSSAQLALESLRSAFVDLYSQAVFLENFGGMNYAAFDHLAQKFHSLRQSAEAKHRTPNDSAENLIPSTPSHSAVPMDSVRMEGKGEGGEGKHSENSPSSSEVCPSLSSLRLLFDLCPFSHQRSLADLKDRVEKIVAKHFFNSNVMTAKAILQSRAKPNVDWELFNVGVRVGVLLLLVFWVLWDCVVDARIRPPQVDTWLSAVLPIYRGLGCLILLIWCWGANLWTWHRTKVHFTFLLDLDPRYAPNYSEVFSYASTLTIVALANFLLFFKTLRGDFPDWVPSGYWPMFLFLYLIFKFFPWPWKNFNFFSKVILKVFCAPFLPVAFVDTFVGDIMTSLVKVFIDLAYTTCFAINGYWRHELTADFTNGCTGSSFYSLYAVPILSAAPLWFRFLQCLRRYRDSGDRHPNLSNSGKYACSIIVVMFGAFHSFASIGNADFYKVLWLTFFFITTLYAFLWDVLMDWKFAEEIPLAERTQNTQSTHTHNKKEDKEREEDEVIDADTDVSASSHVSSDDVKILDSAHVSVPVSRISEDGDIIESDFITVPSQGVGDFAPSESAISSPTSAPRETDGKADGNESLRRRLTAGGVSSPSKSSHAAPSVPSSLFSLSCWRLRVIRMIRRPWVYWFSVVEDFILRFAWTLTLVPQEGSPFGDSWVFYVTPILAIVEIIRRSIWANFRVEWEHVSTSQSNEFIPIFSQRSTLTMRTSNKGGWQTAIEIGGISVIVLALTLTAFLTR